MAVIKFRGSPEELWKNLMVNVSNLVVRDGYLCQVNEPVEGGGGSFNIDYGDILPENPTLGQMFFLKHTGGIGGGVYVGPEPPEDENINLWLDDDDDAEDYGGVDVRGNSLVSVNTPHAGESYVTKAEVADADQIAGTADLTGKVASADFARMLFNGGNITQLTPTYESVVTDHRISAFRLGQIVFVTGYVVFNNPSGSYDTVIASNLPKPQMYMHSPVASEKGYGYCTVYDDGRLAVRYSATGAGATPRFSLIYLTDE